MSIRAGSPQRGDQRLRRGRVADLGARYKEEEDVLRVKVTASSASAFQEKFNISVEKNKVVLRWENTEVAFGVKGGK